MKLSQLTLALAALLSTVVAQGLGDLPDCARSCATDAIPASCGIDVKCICTTKSFLSDISCCVADKCSKDDQETTLKVAKSICARGGVTDVPSSVVCSTGASASTGTKTGTETKTGTTTGTGTAATADTTKDSTMTGTKTTATGTHASGTGSSTAASTSAAHTTNAAVFGQVKDTSLMAAAGAVAAVAFFV
ncbi:hypothetical protein N7509_002222 [Penicillium cosmopolitanum]|uniref:CFEM domain-containing protein n=1 Tax=Penicillium cosmopolitanum TaxID=1131564 RepID=A0A9W9W8N2_9EURO|nr:uncharacterized protein N7509_002222 [Penicillium cosmopolitanum]KAJ5408339.1 hypothetical protein N7509_002222 [Penicillium cosmopolitanum]